MMFKSSNSSFLDKGTTFEGHLTFRDTIRIDGRFKGSIVSTGTLIVGCDGAVEAEIRAGRVVIAGRVQGTVMAQESIEVQFPARVFGEIQAPVITIQPGVFFEGVCRTLPAPREGAPLKLAMIRPRSADPDGSNPLQAQTGS